MLRSLYLSANWLEGMNYAGSSSARLLWVPLLTSLALSLVLYFPLLGNSFAADDFSTIYRVGVASDIMGTKFFRPLSDFTIYLNYLASGADPRIYHLTNIVLHAFCAFILFRFCLIANYFRTDDLKRKWFASISALLFLTYPFHNESIAWVVGRGSIIATFFGLATMLIVVSDMARILKFVCASLCFFIGLLAYESILVLPAIVLILARNHGASLNDLFKWLVVFVSVVTFHFVLRYHFAGSLIGDYEKVAFSNDVISYIRNILKVTGRMLLPPGDNSVLMAILFCLVMITYILCRSFWRSNVRKYSFRKKEMNTLLLLLIATLVPVAFSVSTRTSEGERLLYFPSVFLNMLFGLMLVELVNSRFYRRLIFFTLLLYNIVFSQMSNRNWQHASQLTRTLITQIKNIAASENQVLLINLPGEFRGAYIFRNSFEAVKLLSGIDTDRIKVANYMNHAECSATPDLIVPSRSRDTVCFGLAACLSGKRLLVIPVDRPNERAHTIVLNEGVQIWFWDKQKLVKYADQSSIP